MISGDILSSTIDTKSSIHWPIFISPVLIIPAEDYAVGKR
jgi:hypothetical protein